MFSTLRRCLFSLVFPAVWLIGAPPLHAQTLTVLFSFTGSFDGGNPNAGLVLDTAGNLYGTTTYGGSGVFNCPYGCGTVFKLDPAGQETVLHDFGITKADGENPWFGTLFRDASGNLYGTAYDGGIHGSGAVFRISPAGQESLLPLAGGAGGAFPYAGLIPDTAGNLYGTTFTGGTSCVPGGCGTVFKVSNTGKESVLYSFCSQANCADGLLPYGGLVRDSAGNLYGTTLGGGNGCQNGGCGTVFKVSNTGTETVLHSFGSGTDGSFPYSGLVHDHAGNLYGTTSQGGTYNGGTVYKITPAGQETVLYSFCPQSGCLDGLVPQAAVVLDSAGNLYGTTVGGGTNGVGTVFELSPSGQETVLYSFCSQMNCTDGQAPYGSLVRDSAGNIYGTTNSGGAYASGTVFKLVP